MKRVPMASVVLVAAVAAGPVFAQSVRLIEAPPREEAGAERLAVRSTIVPTTRGSWSPKVVCSPGDRQCEDAVHRAEAAGLCDPLRRMEPRATRSGPT